MSKKIKLTLTLTSIVLLIIAITTAGVSYAVWTSADGSEIGATNTVTPTVQAQNEWVWAKYFNYQQVGNSNAIAITTFYINGDAPAGVNLQDVIIPSVIDGKTVTHITNQVFMDSTLKELPITIYIPASVTNIDANAFSNLPNLKKVVFTAGNGNCEIGAFAFSFCPQLTEVVVETGRTISLDPTAFLATPYLDNQQA